MSSKEIIESGLLELYALGSLTSTELDIVTAALTNDPLIRTELEKIEQTLFQFALANSVVPNPNIKLSLMAKVDYIERLKKGEMPVSLPVLTSETKVSYFDQWLNREDLQRSPYFEEAQALIISDEPDKQTAIVWLKSGAPPETHVVEHEKFLIVEGACDITIGTEVHSLRPGDYLSIPLHVSHHVRVTSDTLCKIILQRVKTQE